MDIFQEHATQTPQGSICKTTSLKKSHVGLTFIRDSDIRHKSFTERAPKLGGLVEFYRSPARVAWTPTGTNVPDYPKMAQLWWQNIGEASSGAISVDKAMDNLAREQDAVMERIERSGIQGNRGPKLNKCVDEKTWLNKPGGVGTATQAGQWESLKVRRWIMTNS